MRRLLFLLLAFVWTGHCQTAVFPGGVVGDNQLTVACEGLNTTLAAGIGATDTTIQLVQATGLKANCTFTIGGTGGEQVQVCAAFANTVTIGHSSCPNVDGRGFGVIQPIPGQAGPTATSHSSDAKAQTLVSGWSHNATGAEVKALESTIGSPTLSTNLPAAGALNIQPVMTDPSLNGGIWWPVYINQADPTKLSANAFLNGLGINMFSSNPQGTNHNQNAAIMGFWYSLGGADPFGGDFHGIIPANATAAPNYVVGMQASAELNSPTYVPGQASWPVLANCNSPAGKLCTSYYVATGTGAGFILSNDATSMTNEGIVLVPANDSNPGYRAFGIVNHANSQSNYYASKDGYVFARTGMEANGVNFVAGEIGATNAIAGSLRDTAILPASTTTGLCVTVLLQHGLTGGAANTFALNGGAAVPIKSHFNPTLNITTGYNIGSFWMGCYNYNGGSAVWEDMSQ